MPCLAWHMPASLLYLYLHMPFPDDSGGRQGTGGSNSHAMPMPRACLRGRRQWRSQIAANTCLPPCCLLYPYPATPTCPYPFPSYVMVGKGSALPDGLGTAACTCPPPAFSCPSPSLLLGGGNRTGLAHLHTCTHSSFSIHPIFYRILGLVWCGFVDFVWLDCAMSRHTTCNFPPSLFGDFLTCTISLSSSCLPTLYLSFCVLGKDTSLGTCCCCLPPSWEELWWQGMVAVLAHLHALLPPGFPLFLPLPPFLCLAAAVAHAPGERASSSLSVLGDPLLHETA